MIGGSRRGGSALPRSAALLDYLVELINAVLPPGEQPVATFGNEAVCTGGLPELRA